MADSAGTRVGILTVGDVKACYKQLTFESI